MAFVAHTERRPPAEVTCHLATAETRSEARIELLQRMPIFGGIRADVLKYLLGLCSVVSVPTIPDWHSSGGLACGNPAR